ncbi:MAG: hypothetical protein NTV86_15295, partial [Planctomycetota bacterium]|nr:hypothetical protein [Planctomycetota bacterium]
EPVRHRTCRRWPATSPISPAPSAPHWKAAPSTFCWSGCAVRSRAIRPSSICQPTVRAASSPTDAARQGLVEFRLGSPAGEVLGVLQADQDACAIRDVRGIHSLYICFPEGLSNAMMDYFLFENAPQGR